MILLDFDGVLMDSVAEVAVSAYNACTRRLVTGVAELPGGLLDTFKGCRHFMRKPAEAIPLMSWCLSRTSTSAGGDLDRETFERLCRSSPLPAETRRQRLFAARQDLTRKKPEAFLALNRPFQPLWDYLAKRGGAPPVLLTTKNREAVLTLCQHFGLAVDAGDVYAGDEGTSKTVNMEAVHDRFGASRYFFIDDLLPNLLEVKEAFRPPGVVLTLFLADWGYGTAKDAATAPRKGIRAIDQQAAMDLLETHCRP